MTTATAYARDMPWRSRVQGEKNIDPLAPSRGLFRVNINGDTVNTLSSSLRSHGNQRAIVQPKVATRPDGLVASSSPAFHGNCAPSRLRLSFIVDAGVANRPVGPVRSGKDTNSRE